MSRYGTREWTRLMLLTTDLPPNARSVIYALGRIPDGPHYAFQVSEIAGLTESATDWMLRALEDRRVIVRDDTPGRMDCYVPSPT